LPDVREPGQGWSMVSLQRKGSKIQETYIFRFFEKFGTEHFAWEMNFMKASTKRKKRNNKRQQRNSEESISNQFHDASSYTSIKGYLS
jgi:hypothetical protein